MDKCDDKITVTDYIFFTKHHAQRKILNYILCRVVDPSKKVPDLNCEVQDLLLEVVDLKQKVPDLRSGRIPHNSTPADRITVCRAGGRGRDADQHDGQLGAAVHLGTALPSDIPPSPRHQLRLRSHHHQ